MDGCFQMDVDVRSSLPTPVLNVSESERLMAFLNDADLFGMWSESGIPVSESVSLSHIPFWAAVTRLSGDLAQAESELKLPVGPGEELEIMDSQAIEVMRNPNPYMTELTFRETIYKDMFCWGNGLAEILRDAAGRPTQLTPLYPQHTWLWWDEEGFMWYVTSVHVGGKWKSYKLPPQDVYHLKWLTYNGLWGYTLISLLRNSIGWGLGMTKHGNRMFANNARPDGILTTDAALRDETLDKIRQTWNSYHQGLDNVGRTALLHSGLKYQQMSMSNRDAEFISSKKLDREDWATAFGMPAHMLNARDRPTFASVESDYRNYLNHTLARHLTAENQESRAKLLSRRDRAKRMYFTHDVSRFLQANIEARASATSQAVGGPWMTREEARVRLWNLNAKPVEGQTFLERSTGAPVDNKEALPATEQNLDDNESIDSEYQRFLAGQITNKVDSYDVGFADYQKGIGSPEYDDTPDESDDEQNGQDVKGHLPGKHDQSKHGEKQGGAEEEEAKKGLSQEPGSAVDGEAPPAAFDDRYLGTSRAKYANAVRVGNLFAANKIPEWSRQYQNPKRDKEIYKAIKGRYKATQKELGSAGINSIEAYRGIDVPINDSLAKDLASNKIKIGDTITLKRNSFASYSTDKDVAETFAETPIPTVTADGEFASPRIDGQSVGVLVRRVIKKQHVVAHPKSSRAYARQSEVVAIHDGEMQVEIVGVYDLENVNVQNQWRNCVNADKWRESTQPSQADIDGFVKAMTEQKMSPSAITSIVSLAFTIDYAKAEQMVLASSPVKENGYGCVNHYPAKHDQRRE